MTEKDGLEKVFLALREGRRTYACLWTHSCHLNAGALNGGSESVLAPSGHHSGLLQTGRPVLHPL